MKVLEFIAKESNGRLDADDLLRIAKLSEYGFMTGFILGGGIGGQTAFRQFMAEHQHLFQASRKRSEWVALLRNRNYRVMAGFGQGGIVRGVQLGAMCALYGVVRTASASLRGHSEGWPKDAVWLDDLASGLMAGSSFALSGRGHRIQYLLKGSKYGLLFGGLLAALRYGHNRLGSLQTMS